MSFRRLWLSGWIAVLAALGCNPDAFSNQFHSQPVAPSLRADQIEALEHLGPTVVDGGLNFSVYSEHATRVEVLLFDDPEADRPTQRFELTRHGDVWNVWVRGIGLGQHYGYVAWGPNWPYDPDWYCGSIEGFVADVDATGNRFNPNKLLIDPYAKAIHRDHDWARGSTASGPARTDCTYGAGSKSVVVESAYVWSDHETEWRANRMDPGFEGHGYHDLIIYEVHPKGFTRETASRVEHPGSYRGIGEMAPYLEELGVTAVELLPIHEKALDGGYWGYWTLNFFAPEITYSSTEDPLRVLDEFKWMVDELHKHGIEVILDVVYNHTGEGGLWRSRRYVDDFSVDPGLDARAVELDSKELASIYSFRGLDNQAYYALSEDNQTYWNNTGVGNDTRANHRPFRRLILDSLRFYVEELHVDGFRFDLAAILGQVDGDYNQWDDPANTVLQEIIDDPILAAHNTRIIAEPWSAGGGYWDLVVGGYPASRDRPGIGWYEWNPHYRHWWRSFVNQDEWQLSSMQGPADGGYTMTGSHGLYSWNGRRPHHSVNYITSHDGFTMYDLVSFEMKQNRCGMLNPVCCSDPTSPWCETDSGDDDNRSRDWGDEAIKRQMMRNFFVALMISHGTPMILGGDEWMRTQYGNNNAYSTGADNEWNWFRWGDWMSSDPGHRMHDFVRQAIRLRREHGYAFAPADWESGAPFAWKDRFNVDKTVWSDRHVMMHYYDPTSGPELLVLINMERDWTEFTLPEGRTWRRLIDTQAHFEEMGPDPRTSGNATLDDPLALPDATYNVPSSTIVVLKAAAD
jgi:glycogen operon protein